MLNLNLIKKQKRATNLNLERYSKLVSKFAMLQNISRVMQTDATRHKYLCNVKVIMLSQLLRLRVARCNILYVIVKYNVYILLLIFILHLISYNTELTLLKCLKPVILPDFLFVKWYSGIVKLLLISNSHLLFLQ